MKRIIFHIDFDAFFASVEESHNPSLKNKPLVVAGNHRHGVVSSANYIARSYGIKSAEPVYQALRKCPNLKIVACDFDKYTRASENFIRLLKNKVSFRVETLSIDECFVDVSDTCLNESASVIEAYAKQVQSLIQKELNLGVSIGVSSNKFLSKLATDMNKPNGVTLLFPNDVKQKAWPLPVGNMSGVGKLTQKHLKQLGIQTIGDLANFKNIYALQSCLGNSGMILFKNAWGFGDDYVDFKHDQVKSISLSRTSLNHVYSYQEAKQFILNLCDELYDRILDKQMFYKTIFSSIKTIGGETRSKRKTSTTYQQSLDDLKTVSVQQFDELWDGSAIRLFSVGVTDLKNKSEIMVAMNLFESDYKVQKNIATPARNELLDIADNVNNQLGVNVLKLATKLDK